MNDESECHEFDAVALRRGLVEHHELRVLGMWLRERVVLERTEARGEADLALGRQRMLITEEEHEVLAEGLLDGGHDLGIIGRGHQVDAVHLGAEGRGERTDVESELRRAHRVAITVHGEGSTRSGCPSC